MLTRHILLKRLSMAAPPTTITPRPQDPKRFASVALIFAGPEEDPHLSMILRAQRASDKWSGQMAFPGGRASHDDPSLLHVAIRETREEIGLELLPSHHIASLDELPLHQHGDANFGILAAHLFSLPYHSLPTLSPDPNEVADAFWIPLTHLYNPAHADVLHWQFTPDQTTAFPGIRYKEQIIWGLSYRILILLSTLLNLSLPMPDLNALNTK